MSTRMRMVWPRPKGRTPQNEDQVTFKLSKEFKLRDRIVEEVANKTTPCLPEMSLVFTCLKDNNFREKECLEEVKNFRNCCMAAAKKQKEISLRRKNPGKVHAQGERMITSEINAMLAKYKKGR